MALSTTQQLILENAKEGHSLLILGQRGIGKSHLVKDYFELDNNPVYIMNEAFHKEWKYRDFFLKVQ